jgi:hypothetical protein
MSREEKDKVWREMVSRSDERVRSGLKGVKRKERGVMSRERGVNRSFVSDLKLLVIMLVVWFCFFGVVEFTGAGGC